MTDELIVFRSFWHKLTNGIEVDEDFLLKRNSRPKESDYLRL